MNKALSRLFGSAVAASSSRIVSGSSRPAAPGTYYLEVDVRNQGSPEIYEVVGNITYVVT